MVTFGQVRRWQPPVLDDIESLLKDRGDQLLGFADELQLAMTPVSWTGAAAEAAEARRRKLGNDMQHLVAEVHAARTAFIDASESVDILLDQITEADVLGQAHGMRIADDGAVIDHGPAPGTPQDQLAAVNAERQHIKADLDNRVRQIITQAEQIDSTLADVLREIEHGQITDGGATTLAAAGRAGAAQGSLHDELLAEYKVAPDPDGMVEVPFTELKLTASEAAHLMDLGILGASDAYGVYKTALDDARGPFNSVGESNGHTDAVRHVYWNAMLANRFGPEWTEGYTTAHERKPHEEGVHASEQAMDLHNNEVGRRIAAAHPDAGPDELLRYAEEAVRNGDTVVIGTDGRLVRSDEVPVGQTLLEEATDPPPNDGRDPGMKYENTPGGYDYGGGYNPGRDGDNYGTYDVR